MEKPKFELEKTILKQEAQLAMIKAKWFLSVLKTRLDIIKGTSET